MAGAAFSANVSATAIGGNPEDFEDLYDRLARRHRLLRSAGTQQFPDGTVFQRDERMKFLRPDDAEKQVSLPGAGGLRWLPIGSQVLIRWHGNGGTADSRMRSSR